MPGNETNFQTVAAKVSELALAIEEDVPPVRVGQEEAVEEEQRPMLSWEA